MDPSLRRLLGAVHLRLTFLNAKHTQAVDSSMPNHVTVSMFTYFASGLVI
jgi:hypothetical protein